MANYISNVADSIKTFPAEFNKLVKVKGKNDDLLLGIFFKAVGGIFLAGAAILGAVALTSIMVTVVVSSSIAIGAILSLLLAAALTIAAMDLFIVGKNFAAPSLIEILSQETGELKGVGKSGIETLGAVRDFVGGKQPRKVNNVQTNVMAQRVKTMCAGTLIIKPLVNVSVVPILNLLQSR